MTTDQNLISELYNKNIRGGVLNEMTPFVGDQYGDFGSERAHKSYDSEDPDLFKAFVRPQYQSAMRRFADDPKHPLYIRQIVDFVGKEILAQIADEDGRIEDNKREVAERAGSIIGQKFGFPKTHLKHLGRNVIDALIRAQIIKEVDSARGRGGSKGKAKFDPSVFDDLD